MKTFLYIMCCAVVISCAYWAYKENYRTQASLRRVSDLQQQIAAGRESISVLKAEWAYLNRPDRLRELVDLNYDALGLLPLMPDHFAEVELVAYPQAQIEANELVDPVSTSNTGSDARRSPDKEFP
ncbi:MAG: cell division protein FtsL [Amylibacter sp.]